MIQPIQEVRIVRSCWNFRSLVGLLPF